MKIDPIKYKKGYKYQLEDDFKASLNFECPDVESDYIRIKDNVLYIKKGYAWDGCSGPTIDSIKSMRASLVHDALYQLIRYSLIPAKFRLLADLLFYVILKLDRFNPMRAWYYYQAVKNFACKAASPSHKKKVITAPK